MWYQNIRSALFSFVTIHASDGQTDRRTDRQTELRQQYRALHYIQSHGKNPDIEYLHKLEFHSYYGNESQTENIYDHLRQIL